MKSQLASLAIIVIALTVASTTFADRYELAQNLLGRWRLLRMRDKQDQAGVGPGSRSGRFFTRGFIVEYQPNHRYNVFPKDSVAVSDTLGTYNIEDESTVEFHGPDGVYTEKYTVTDLPLRDTLKLKGNSIVAWYIRLKPGAIMPE